MFPFIFFYLKVSYYVNQTNVQAGASLHKIPNKFKKICIIS